MTALPHIEYFLGANSPTGFYSLYDHLLPPEQARALYILKGGPGCGKSTLLKFLLGEETASDGTLVKLSGLTVSYVPQDTSHLRGRLRVPCPCARSSRFSRCFRLRPSRLHGTLSASALCLRPSL